MLGLVAKGKVNKEIAAELGAAEQTVKQHRGRVMQELQVKSVADLVRLVERAASQSWTPPRPFERARSFRLLQCRPERPQQ